MLNKTFTWNVSEIKLFYENVFLKLSSELLSTLIGNATQKILFSKIYCVIDCIKGKRKHNNHIKIQCLHFFKMIEYNPLIII